MKNSKLALLIAAFFAAAVGQAQMVSKVTDPVEWVNPLMGTDSKPRFPMAIPTRPLLCPGV